jgi:hypothetical protein
VGEEGGFEESVYVIHEMLLLYRANIYM